MILTFYRFLPLGNAILSNLAKNTGSSDVKGTGRSEMTEVTPGGGYCHIWTIWVCAAVKGIVFKQFTLG